jgi:hypothetical protein
MILTSSGAVRRVDLAPLLDLAPALWGEWRTLRFDGSGAAINPLGATTRHEVRLLKGRHRRRGARYRLTVPARSALDGPTRLDVVLEHDDAWRTAFTVTAEGAPWSLAVDVHHARLPRVEVSVRTRLASPAGAGVGDRPGCLARLAGTGRGQATMASAVLDGHGTALVAASGRMPGFRARAVIDVDARDDRWVVNGRVTILARGLGRPVLLLAGWPLRRRFGAGCRCLWRDADRRSARAERDLRLLAASVEKVGDPKVFVRRLLWERDFDWRAPSRA